MARAALFVMLLFLLSWPWGIVVIGSFLVHVLLLEKHNQWDKFGSSLQSWIYSSVILHFSIKYLFLPHKYPPFYDSKDDSGVKVSSFTLGSVEACDHMTCPICPNMMKPSYLCPLWIFQKPFLGCEVIPSLLPVNTRWSDVSVMVFSLLDICASSLRPSFVALYLSWQ